MCSDHTKSSISRLFGVAMFRDDGEYGGIVASGRVVAVLNIVQFIAFIRSSMCKCGMKWIIYVISAAQPHPHVMFPLSTLV